MDCAVALPSLASPMPVVLSSSCVQASPAGGTRCLSEEIKTSPKRNSVASRNNNIAQAADCAEARPPGSREVQVGELQQLDGRHELRRHHERVALTHFESSGKRHVAELARRGPIDIINPLMRQRAGRLCLSGEPPGDPVGRRAER